MSSGALLGRGALSGREERLGARLDHVFERGERIARGVERPVERRSHGAGELDEGASAGAIDRSVAVEHAENDRVRAGPLRALDVALHDAKLLAGVEEVPESRADEHVKEDAAGGAHLLDQSGARRRPPLARSEQSSMRSAPPSRAATADSTESRQTSTMTRPLTRLRSRPRISTRALLCRKFAPLRAEYSGAFLRAPTAGAGAVSPAADSRARGRSRAPRASPSRRARPASSLSIRRPPLRASRAGAPRGVRSVSGASTTASPSPAARCRPRSRRRRARPRARASPSPCSSRRGRGGSRASRPPHPAIPRSAPPPSIRPPYRARERRRSRDRSPCRGRRGFA